MIQHEITFGIFLALSSAVFNSYDSQVNDDNSCNFDGTAERQYVLNDGTLTGNEAGQCLVKDSANAQDICGSMQWACYDQNYADVSACVNTAIPKLFFITSMLSGGYSTYKIKFQHFRVHEFSR